MTRSLIYRAYAAGARTAADVAAYIRGRRNFAGAAHAA